MANPYDVDHVVTAEEAPLNFPANSCTWYQEGEIVKMTAAEALTCAKLLPDVAPNTDCCFPEYRVGEDGWPTKGYRNRHTIPAGATDFVVEVASIEGCKPPGMVCVHQCGDGCLSFGYDAAPVLGDVTDGTAADAGPTCRDLIDKYGNCIETIHVANSASTDVVLTLSYYC